MFACGLLAVEPIEVTQFQGITKRGFFTQPTVDDMMRGFPRVEFAVRHNIAPRWSRATVFIEVHGADKKGQPISHANTVAMGGYTINSRTFSTPLPQTFSNGEVTSVTMRVIDGAFERQMKTVFAKSRVVILNKTRTADYEDDHVAMQFSLIPDRNRLAVKLENKTALPIAFHPTRRVAADFETKNLPGPNIQFEERYPVPAVAAQLLEWVAPKGSTIEEIAIEDRSACAEEQSGPVEIERDPLCKSEDSPLLKYGKVIEDGYILIRALLPVRIGEEIRQYVFTFVVTVDSETPKKRNPEEVVV